MAELAETPNLASAYCPSCDPERDPIRELLTVRWCDAHEPKYQGLDDEKATVGTGVLDSGGQAQAETNRQWCQLVHRTVRARNDDRSRAPLPIALVVR
jgi:hypothetical protein